MADQQETTNSQSLDIDKRIGQYVALRDKISQLDDEHKQKMKPYREMLETLGNMLLEHLNTIGGESIRAKSGTIYKSSRTTASLADPDKFMRYVIDNDYWDLLDRKANATACMAHIEDTGGTPPPGVNLTVKQTVNVRRK